MGHMSQGKGDQGHSGGTHKNQTSVAVGSGLEPHPYPVISLFLFLFLLLFLDSCISLPAP